MGEITHIQWTDHTFNPWEGCTKVSTGCAHCYAETRNARFGGGTPPNWGKGAPRRRTSTENWKQPLRWNKHWDQEGMSPLGPTGYRRPRVFCASLADWLDDEVPIEWLADLLNLIRLAPNLDWQLLTKRPENWLDRISKVFAFAVMSPPHHNLCAWLSQWHPAYDSVGGVRGSPVPPSNVWIGTSVENQAAADTRIPILLTIPARVRFLSMEPLLGPVDLMMFTAGAGIRPDKTTYRIPGVDWVIVGGESGPDARPMHPDWALSVRDQCLAASIPFFFKQWGEWTPGENLTKGGTLRCAWWQGEDCGFDRWIYGTQTEKESENTHRDDAPDLYWVGKIAAGRLLDGKTYDQFPK